MLKHSLVKLQQYFIALKHSLVKMQQYIIKPK
jgi:hypothetical protein